MKVLALTSSTSQASIAIGDESRTFERHHSVPRGHTEFMNSALAELLTESSWSLTDLDLIAVDQGPGSFTGIRVSVSIARSLCYMLGKPAYVVESIDLLAAGAVMLTTTSSPLAQKPQSPLESTSAALLKSQNFERPFVVGINAFKNLIFSTIFLPGQPRLPSRVLTVPQLEAWIAELAPGTTAAQPGTELNVSPLPFLGDAWDVYAKDWSPALRARVQHSPTDNHPRASTLLQKALNSEVSCWTQDWKSIIPLYLRESAAEENLRKS